LRAEQDLTLLISAIRFVQTCFSVFLREQRDRLVEVITVLSLSSPIVQEYLIAENFITIALSFMDYLNPSFDDTCQFMVVLCSDPPEIIAKLPPEFTTVHEDLLISVEDAKSLQ
jgi:hypothetical protein